MSTPRIAIVFRGIGDIGGTNNTIADHARAFVDAGYHVDLIGEKVHRGGVSPDMGHGRRIRRLPLFKRWRWKYFADRADAIVARGGYDFVAGHGHHRRQDVLSMHNCLHLAHEAVYGKALETAGTLAEIHDDILTQKAFSVCICNSRLMQNDLALRYGIDTARLPIVHPGYRPEQFNPADRPRYRDTVRAELGVADGLLLGLVTSGDFAKRGLDILLAAYARLTADLRAKSRLLVLGKQGGNAAFVQCAQTLGIADRLIFVGATREPQRYFHALDICVHPARIEEFGQVVQEAMACGLPVVSTRAVGAMERLPRAMFDSLAERPDSQNLADALAAMIGSAARRAEWAEAGRAAVAGNTDTANVAATWEIYRRAGLAERA